MEPKLLFDDKMYDVAVKASNDITTTLPDNSPHKFDIIPVGVNRDGYIKLRHAQHMVENSFWSVDAAAFLSREEILILEEHNAYKKEVDKYLNDGQG